MNRVQYQKKHKLNQSEIEERPYSTIEDKLVTHSTQKRFTELQETEIELLEPGETEGIRKLEPLKEDEFL